MASPEVGFVGPHCPLNSSVENLPRELRTSGIRQYMLYKRVATCKLTAGFMAVSKLCSSMTLTSDRRKCLSDGYSMHHTSLAGRCLAAAAMKAAAPK